jgi:hypothetical protein
MAHGVPEEGRGTSRHARSAVREAQRALQAELAGTPAQIHGVVQAFLRGVEPRSRMQRQ